MKYSVKLYIKLYAQLYTFTGHTTNNNVMWHPWLEDRTFIHSDSVLECSAEATLLYRR